MLKLSKSKHNKIKEKKIRKMQTDEKITALGVGKKGCQIVENMLEKIDGVKFADMCFQEDNVLTLFNAPLKFNIENNDDCKKIINENFNDAEIFFVIGDSLLVLSVAKAAKEAGKFIIGITTASNEELRAEFKQISDALISFNEVISSDEQIKLSQNVVESIADLLTKSGFVNLEIEDIKAILQNTGTAFLVTGTAEGENRAKTAALQAIGMCSKLKNAKRILLNVTTGSEISLSEIANVAEILEENASPDAMVIWGHIIDKNIKGSMKITFIAGMDDKI